MGDAAELVGLADFIRSRSGDILTDWVDEVQQVAAARPLPEPILLDHIPELLEEIAALADDLAHGRPPELPWRVAERHAISRLDTGYDLTEVVREHLVLRTCIARRWQQERPSPQTDGGRAILDRAIETALLAAIEHFTRARDRTLEALDRVASAALQAESLDELLGELLRVLLDTTQSVDTAVVLLREGEELVARASVGLEQDAQPFRLPIGEGFAGRVAGTRQPLLLHDAASDPLVKSEVIRRKGVKALYGIPLQNVDRVIGVVHMGSLTASDFSDQDKRLLNALGSRATAAIVQQVLKQEAYTRARQQAAVADLGHRTLTHGDVQRVLDDAVAIVAETLGTELSAIFELLAHGRALVLRAGVGWQEGIVGRATIAAGIDSQAGYTLMAGEPVTVDDLRSERRFTAPSLLHEQQVVSGMSVIIRMPGEHGRPYGVFGAHTRIRRLFTRDDVHFLQAVANIVGAAIASYHGERRERFLSHASRVLAESLDSEKTLKTVAHLAVPDFADWCVVDLVQEDGSLGRVAIAHRDPARVGMAEELRRRYPPRSDSPRGPAGVIRTRQSEFVPFIDDDVIKAIAVDAEHRRILHTLGLTSYVAVPLIARGAVLGAITLVTEGGRALGEDHLATAEELARRAATAIDNARLYQQSQHAAHAREEVLRIVSHDLRGPLGAITTGAAGQIRLAPDDAAGRTIQRYAETIQRSARRMTRLIDDLTDVASIEAGQLAIERAPEDPRSIVREIVDTFQAAAAERATTLRAELAAELPTIQCDRARVLQALSNIVENAVKVTSSGFITVRAAARGGEVVFAVEDTGPGIAADDLPHVFKRHWRSRNAPYTGTGLGLAIAKGIVDAHGGRIRVESPPGGGATFFVELPAA